MASVTLKKAWRSMGGGPSWASFGVALILAILWLTPGCPPPPVTEKLNKEMEALKAEVAAVKEKLSKVEASQKAIMEMMKARAAAPETAVPGAEAELPGLQLPSTHTPGAPLTLDELVKNQNQLLGTRVKVKGVPGPVMMHKKTLFMSTPGGGMVEVIYGNLQDKKQIERLTSQAIDTPITVTGLLSAAPGQSKDQVRLIIMADSVDF